MKKHTMAAAASGPTVRIVAQRVTKAALLVDNVARYVSIGDGVIIHVAFLQGATETAIDAAVKQVCSTRVFLIPAIGATAEQRAAVTATDGTAATRPKPVALAESDCDVLVVPQATMAGKPKGKVVQYHGQAPKDDALALYGRFCSQLRACLVPAEHQSVAVDANGEAAPATATPAEASDSPSQLRKVSYGTYGNRQGLEMSSPGPFTHIFEV